jgi:hypothetical protein
VGVSGIVGGDDVEARGLKGVSYPSAARKRV